MLWGKVLRAPVVIFAIPVQDREGRHVGLLAGSIALRSAALFAEVRASAQSDRVRDLVVDRSGHILAHQDLSRVMQRADDEPGLRDQSV